MGSFSPTEMLDNPKGTWNVTKKVPERKALRTYPRTSQKKSQIPRQGQRSHTNQGARDGVRFSQLPRKPLAPEAYQAISQELIRGPLPEERPREQGATSTSSPKRRTSIGKPWPRPTATERSWANPGHSPRIHCVLWNHLQLAPRPKGAPLTSPRPLPPPKPRR